MGNWVISDRTNRSETELRLLKQNFWPRSLQKLWPSDNSSHFIFSHLLVLLFIVLQHQSHDLGVLAATELHWLKSSPAAPPLCFNTKLSRNFPSVAKTALRRPDDPLFSPRTTVSAERLDDRLQDVTRFQIQLLRLHASVPSFIFRWIMHQIKTCASQERLQAQRRSTLRNARGPIMFVWNDGNVLSSRFWFP